MRADDKSSSCSSRFSMSATVSRKITSTRGSSTYRSAGRKRIIRSRNQVASSSPPILAVPITHPKDSRMVYLVPSNSRVYAMPPEGPVIPPTDRARSSLSWMRQDAAASNHAIPLRLTDRRRNLDRSSELEVSDAGRLSPRPPITHFPVYWKLRFPRNRSFWLLSNTKTTKRCRPQ